MGYLIFKSLRDIAQVIQIPGFILDSRFSHIALPSPIINQVFITIIIIYIYIYITDIFLFVYVYSRTNN